MQNCSRSEKTDAGNNLCGNYCGIAAKHLSGFRRNTHEQRAADTNQNVRAETRRLLTNLAFQPDDAAEYGCQNQLQCDCWIHTCERSKPQWQKRMWRAARLRVRN